MKRIFFNIFISFWWLVSCVDEITKDLLTPWREYGETCGYESCPLSRKGVLNIHIVPNTHMEVGFSNTIDEHYTGEDEELSPRQRNAQKVLDAVVTELWANSLRRFTLSDTVFLFYWWANRDATVRRMVYELIRQGRLFLVGGAMGMTDEAAVSYQAVIDHFTYSLRKINATFLDCGRPLVAWQVDVLGHSREFASLMAQMGFDGLFVNPMSYDEEIARMRRRGLEWLWRGSDDLGQASDMYTHKLFDGYWSPPGFCLGKLCEDPLIVTSDTLLRNLEERGDVFVQQMLSRQGPSYATNHIMVMMGHKFAFFDASTWFGNIEKLIDQVNKVGVEKRMNITAFYSSPPCYLQAVNEENPFLETKQDDMFPIAYNKNTYIVGMYTSRPTMKYMVREAYVYLQIAKQLQVTADMGNNEKFFEYFMWIMSLVQDHGIITGAMRDRVFRYYVAKLYAYVDASTVLMSRAFAKLRNSAKHIHYARCMFNISSCNETQYLKHSIYNPLGWPVSVPVRLPCIIKNSKFNVYDDKGNKMKSVTMRTAKPILSIKGRTETDREVVFIAEDIPPIGFRSYFVEADWLEGGERKKRSALKNEEANNKNDIKRQIKSLDIDEENLKKVEVFSDFDFYDEPPFPINDSVLFGKRPPLGTGDTDYEYEVLKFTPDPEMNIEANDDTINTTTLQNITLNVPDRTTVTSIPTRTTIGTNIPTTTTTIPNITISASPNRRLNIPVETATKATTLNKPDRTTLTSIPARTTISIPNINISASPNRRLNNPNETTKATTTVIATESTTEIAETTTILDDNDTTKVKSTTEITKTNTILADNVTEVESTTETAAITTMLSDKDVTEGFSTETTTLADKGTTKEADIETTTQVTKKLTDEGTTLTTKEVTTKLADVESTAQVTIKVADEVTTKTQTEMNLVVATRTTESPDETTQAVTEKEVTLEEVTTEELTENPVETTEKAHSQYVPTVNKMKETNHRKYFLVGDDDNLFIGNKYVRLNLDQDNRTCSIYLCNGVNISLNLQLYYYVSDDPQELNWENRPPGIFTFRPMDLLITPMDGKKYNVEIVKNDIVEELHIQFNEWAFLIIRIYVDSPVIEVNWLVGPVPIEDGLGKDVFIKYATDLKNEGVFYTDSNGRQTLKRIRNKRAYYDPAEMDALAGNLYPVTSKIYIEDKQKNIRFTVFNDRCQAGSSLKEGTIDFMIHRRILTDDVGINVSLNETEHGEGIRVLGTHYLYVTKADYKKNKIFEKIFAKQIEMPPKVLVSYRRDYKPKTMKKEFYNSNNEFSALKNKLPIGVHLLTLQKWSEKLLIRIENYLEKADVLNTGMKTVYLKNLFIDIEILKIKETMLAANIYKENWSTKHWTKKEKFFKNFNENYGSDENTFEEEYVPDEEDSLETGIKLKPQQIRTFIAEFRFKKK